MSSGRLWWQLQDILNAWSVGALGEPDFFTDREVKWLAKEITKVLVRDGWIAPQSQGNGPYYFSQRDYNDGDVFF